MCNLVDGVIPVTKQGGQAQLVAAVTQHKVLHWPIMVKQAAHVPGGLLCYTNTLRCCISN